jgi:hypothetical protein
MRRTRPRHRTRALSVRPRALRAVSHRSRRWPLGADDRRHTLIRVRSKVRFLLAPRPRAGGMRCDLGKRRSVDALTADRDWPRIATAHPAGWDQCGTAGLLNRRAMIELPLAGVKGGARWTDPRRGHGQRPPTWRPCQPLRIVTPLCQRGPPSASLKDRGVDRGPHGAMNLGRILVAWPSVSEWRTGRPNGGADRSVVERPASGVAIGGIGRRWGKHRVGGEP